MGKKQQQQPQAEKTPAKPMKLRTAVILTVVGLVGGVASVWLSAMTAAGFEVVAILPGILLMLLFTAGVSSIAGTRWVLLAGFVLAIFGTMVLSVHGHKALMSAFGEPETCIVENVEKLGKRGSYSMVHQVNCPSKGNTTIAVSGSDEMQKGSATVLFDPAGLMRPVFAERNDYSRGWVIGIPAATAILIMVAAATRAGRRSSTPTGSAGEL